MAPPADADAGAIRPRYAMYLQPRRAVTPATLTLCMLCVALAGCSVSLRTRTRGPAHISGSTAIGRAAAYLPPPGKIFTGVADAPISAYTQFVHKRPAVFQEFLAWGQYLPGITSTSVPARTRLMLHISTANGTREAITPGAIAGGLGDAWLVGLQNEIAASGNVTYVRLMAEMDNANNFYSAYNANGTPRDAAHSTAAFKQAWRRVTLIMRGGRLAHIDAVLRRLGMPGLHTSSDLPIARVAMQWVPEVAGTAAVPDDQPAAYWPGRAWVDWVGTDFYSKFPNFVGLDAFYAEFPRLPFVFGEYALWGADDPGWVERLFAWIATHSRTRMIVYNQGRATDGPFRLYRYPRAARILARQLAGARYLG